MSSVLRSVSAAPGSLQAVMVFVHCGMRAVCVTVTNDDIGAFLSLFGYFSDRIRYIRVACYSQRRIITHKKTTLVKDPLGMTCYSTDAQKAKMLRAFIYMFLLLLGTGSLSFGSGWTKQSCSLSRGLYSA